MNRPGYQHSWVRYSLICGIATMIGCGKSVPEPKVALLRGKVSYQGKPLSSGTIILQPSSGSGASGEISADGRYEVKAVIGPNLVMIRQKDNDDTPVGALESKARMKGKSKIKPTFPPKFGGPNSGLQIEVQSAGGSKDFDLK